MMELIKRFKGTEVELEYLVTGEENAETIVFVHGVGANLRQFIEQHRHFSPRYRVLSISMRGHGKSGEAPLANASNYTIEKNRDDILELLQYLGIEKMHYVGNSAGGLVGFSLMDKRPELFKSMATFGTTAELKMPAIAVRVFVGIDKFMLRFNKGGYLRFLSKSVTKQPEVQQAVYEVFSLSTVGVPYFRANIGNYSYLDTIRRMKVPYLLIKAEYDKDINSNLASTLSAVNANSLARVIEMSDAGHITNLDQPAEFNRIVQEFVESAV